MDGGGSMLEESSRILKCRNRNRNQKQNIAAIEVQKNTDKVRNVVHDVNVKKLKCFYVNARSIMNKRVELELYTLEEKPDIIGITETWVVNDVDDSELNLEGCTMFRRDRVLGVKLRGDGVLLYIKNCFDAIRCRYEFED